jgi:hypothetical protein
VAVIAARELSAGGERHLERRVRRITRLAVLRAPSVLKSLRVMAGDYTGSARKKGVAGKQTPTEDVVDAIHGCRYHACKNTCSMPPRKSSADSPDQAP